MKALITSVSLLLIMVIVISFGMFFLRTQTEDYTAMLEEIKQQYHDGNPQKAGELLDELSRKFEDNHDIISMLVNHVEVTKAETSLAKLKEYLINDSKDLFDAEHGALTLTIDNLYSSEVLNLPNLF